MNSIKQLFKISISDALVPKSEKYYIVYSFHSHGLYIRIVYLFKVRLTVYKIISHFCLIFDETEGANDRNVDNCTSTGKMIGL